MTERSIDRLRAYEPMDKSYSATDLPPSPERERGVRMRNYLIAMGIRVVCIILMLVVREWWALLLCAAGAIFLPYVAVILANVGGPAEGGRLERPMPRELPAVPLRPVDRPAELDDEDRR